MIFTQFKNNPFHPSAQLAQQTYTTQLFWRTRPIVWPSLQISMLFHPWPFLKESSITTSILDDITKATLGTFTNIYRDTSSSRSKTSMHWPSVKSEASLSTSSSLTSARINLPATTINKNNQLICRGREKDQVHIIFVCFTYICVLIEKMYICVL